ncbi:hypothetical protein U1Q18_013485 [Sarracenia purpurea var. burkii]
MFCPSVGSHGVLDIQTPFKHDLEGNESFRRYSSDIEPSQGSQIPEETHRRSFALDRRWLTIHTVCLDLLNSPGTWDMKDMEVLGTAPNMCKAKPYFDAMSLLSYTLAKA